MPALAPPHIADFDLDRLRLHVSQARRHLQAIEWLLPGMEPLTDEDRETVPTIIDEDMADGLGAVLDVMELVPERFTPLPLSPWVWGPDMEGFSVELARHLLEVWRTLRPLGTELDRFSRLVADYLHWIGAPVRNPAGGSPADRALDLAEKDPRLRAALGKSFDYWQQHAPRRMHKLFMQRSAAGGSCPCLSIRPVATARTLRPLHASAPVDGPTRARSSSIAALHHGSGGV